MGPVSGNIYGLGKQAYIYDKYKTIQLNLFSKKFWTLIVASENLLKTIIS